MQARLEIVTEERQCLVKFDGAFLVDTIARSERLLAKTVESPGLTSYRFDLTQLGKIDSAGAIMIVSALEHLAARGLEAELICEDASVLRMLELVKTHRPAVAAVPPPAGNLLERVGEESVAVAGRLFGLMAFFGEAFAAMGRLLKTPSALRWRETVFQMNESAVKALWIIALTMFLIGIVVAYQSAAQLKTYGANIFIVDMLGISIMRELAPMLTAIIVAGRSGSAYAAQIGVMKITEELDAMRTMGFDPFAFLVLPRIFALVIMMPILIFFADIVGLIGGMVIANTQLGLTPQLFMDRFVEVIAVKHFWIGIVKGPFFAILIASIGLFRGLLVKNDTESIGFNTTKSVVESIFAVIICDALFSIIFTEMGF